MLNAVADRNRISRGLRGLRDVEADDEFGNAMGVRRAPSIIDWDVACRDLIDHPNVLPYLVELLGPEVPSGSRLCHFYAEEWEAGQFARWQAGFVSPLLQVSRWRDAVWVVGVDVCVVGRQCGRWRIVPVCGAATRAISGWICRAMCSGLIGFRTMLCSQRQRRGMRFFLRRHWYTVHCRGGQTTSAGCCFTNTVPGHLISAPKGVR